MLFKKTDGKNLLDQDILTAKAILDIYTIIAYDAMAVGPHDLTNGMKFLVESLQKGSPWISANLVTPENTPIFPPWVIRQTTGGKVGILGLTAEVALPQGYMVKKWEDALPGYLDKLSPVCDFIILLSNLDSSANEAIARKFPQINLIISADQKKGNIPPVPLRNTLITQTHTRGKYLGILNVQWSELKIWQDTLKSDPSVASELHKTIDGEGEGNTPAGATFTFRFRSLAKHVQGSPEINERISALKKDIVATNRTTQAHGQKQSPNDNFTTKTLSNQMIVGPENCKQCHEKQYLRWQQTAHAKALDSLVHEQQQYNIRCLSCHVTRDMTTTGDTQDESNLLSLPAELRMVSCESCHGPGRDHAASRGETALQSVTETTCSACHTPDMDDNFNYKEKLKRLSCTEY